MKAFLNKRAKVKYETVPAAPEVTGDYIAEMIGDSEAIADAVADTVEAEASTILEAGSDFASGVATIAFGVVAQSDLGDLSDVTVSDVSSGDTLEYSSGKWRNVAADPREWHKLDTYTCDGSGSIARIPLAADNPIRNAVKIFIKCELAQSVNDASFGIVLEFGVGSSPTRRSIGDLTSGFSSAGKRYVNAYAEGIGDKAVKMWLGNISDAQSVGTGTATIRERLDGYVLTDELPAYIEIRTQTAGEVIPEGTKIDVWYYGTEFTV